MNDLVLGEVKGDRPMRLICHALHRLYGINAGGCPIRYDDTVATYSISTSQKLRKPVEREVVVFVKGMIEMWRLACE